MARGSMPWTIAMDEALSDGEWHSVEDILKIGATQIPHDRALSEMGENRSAQTDEDRRAAAGAKTLARQALMGMKRFGKVEITRDKSRVRKVADNSVSLGALAERVTALEEQLALILDGERVPQGLLSADEVDEALAELDSGTPESETVEILDDPETMAAIAEGQADRS